MTDPTPTLTDEQRARDLTYAIMRHYGYTDEDIIAAEATHPELACGDGCTDEDGLSKHPIYDELASTASLMIDVVCPLIARMVADAEARALREAAEDASECVCGHDCEWHHTERGCQYHGNGPNRCRCQRDAATAVADRLNARADRIGGGG